MIGKALRSALTILATVAVWIAVGAGGYGLYRWYESSKPPPTAICRDGTTSYSQHHSGTCSWHGGVRRWLPAARTLP